MVTNCKLGSTRVGLDKEQISRCGGPGTCHVQYVHQIHGRSNGLCSRVWAGERGYTEISLDCLILQGLGGYTGIETIVDLTSTKRIP